jgi:hypothetical protein
MSRKASGNRPSKQSAKEEKPRKRLEDEEEHLKSLDQISEAFTAISHCGSDGRTTADVDNGC